MELKPGHKPTEVGAIPNDWDVALFKEQFNISAGGDVNLNLSVAEQDEIHSYPIYSNALTNGGLYGYCSYADHPAGSITITARGTLGVAAYRDHKYTAIGRVLVLEPRQETSGHFFAEFINSRVRFAIESTGVPQLTAPQIGLYLLAVPPYHEQRAIAAALSDVDALLNGLDQLITKKRDLKQAAMQQLLTGQTRLPGFSESWVTVQLGDISHIKTGDRNHEDKEDGGRFPFFVRSERVERIDSFSYDCEAIIVPGEGNVGSVLHYVSGRFDLHQRVYKVSDFPECIHGKFIYFAMAQGFGSHAMRNTVKATVDSLRLPTFLSFALVVPSTICEQRAIATVLSDMDAEIAALEARRDKTRDLKLAMMQELLTGKTRLVEPEVAHA